MTSSLDQQLLKLNLNSVDDHKIRLKYIKNQFQQGKTVFKGYQTFCKKFGDDAMKYKDFDFWWYRFENGQNDLDYDRSKDPKTREFSAFPMDVVEKLVEKLELKEKLIVRNLSKGLREAVEKGKYDFKEFQLSVGGKYNWIRSDHERLRWENWKQALRDFVIIMRWPKINLGVLFIDFNWNEQDTTHVLEAFKSIDHQIPVFAAHISVTHVDEVLAVLPYLKPGILKNFLIEYVIEYHYIDLNEIVILDQWKQAKYCIIDQVKELPIESLFHFETIRITVERISIEEFKELKNAFLASPKFKYCYIKVDNKDDNDAIRDAFEDEIIPIPETNQLFEIEFYTEDGVESEDEDEVYYGGPDATFSFKKTDA